MECLIHSPAFNCAKMAWVAGVGVAIVAVAVVVNVTNTTPCNQSTQLP